MTRQNANELARSKTLIKILQLHEALWLALDVMVRDYAWPFPDRVPAHVIMAVSKRLSGSPTTGLMRHLCHRELGVREGFAHGRVETWRLFQRPDALAKDSASSFTEADVKAAFLLYITADRLALLAKDLGQPMQEKHGRWNSPPKKPRRIP